MPSPRDYVVAQKYYQEGLSGKQACLAAGYAKTTAICRGKKIAESQRVKVAMLELSKNVNAGQLADMAMVRLEEDILKPPKEPKARHAIVRTCLEVGGKLGGPSELHLHQHNQLPPKVQEMLEAKMLELMGGANGQAGENQENDGRVQVRDITLGVEVGSGS